MQDLPESTGEGVEEKDQNETAASKGLDSASSGPGFRSGRLDYTSATAEFSPCGVYRYRLTRGWAKSSYQPGAVLFVMLNPSIASAVVDDPTIRRCSHFADGWGHRELWIGNLFALRSTDPAALKTNTNPVGELNDSCLKDMAARAAMIVCAWGTHGVINGRGAQVLAMLRETGVAGKCFHLGLSKERFPKHPLYLRADTQPELFRG